MIAGPPNPSNIRSQNRLWSWKPLIEGTESRPFQCNRLCACPGQQPCHRLHRQPQATSVPKGAKSKGKGVWMQGGKVSLKLVLGAWKQESGHDKLCRVIGANLQKGPGLVHLALAPQVFYLRCGRGREGCNTYKFSSFAAWLYADTGTRRPARALPSWTCSLRAASVDA